MYKKFIKKRGKLIGPYYYESIRLKNGKIKTIYLGRNFDSAKLKDKVALLRAQEVISKGNTVVIPIEPVHRPKRPDYLKPDLSALKEYFGDKFSKVKVNLQNIKLPKFKLPELKFSKDFYQRKLDEYFPKPGLYDFDFHTALTLVLSVIFVFGFFFLNSSYIGLTSLNVTTNLNAEELEQSISGFNGTDVLEESSAIPLVLNVLNYSCIWNGTSFRVCETVEWSGGSYGSGYITGGEAANKAERFTVSPFTYCQDVEKEGKKAVNTYILDEKEKIIEQDLTHDVDCIIGNETIVTISNESLESNETSEQNITETNVTEVNITTVTIESNGTVETIQYQAVINQPVKWKKTIKLENETDNLEVELPKDAKVLSIKEIENESLKDITEEVLVPTTPLTGLSFLLTGFAILEETNTTSIIIEQNVTEVEIEYETEAPTVFEEDLENGKRVTVSSDVHYENILTYTSITESKANEIRLYWITNGTRQEHQIINYSDTNNNGLVDEIYWTTPHLSNQTFEVVIEITKALHLDSNYSVISNIYEEVKALDGNWSEPIYNNEYVRITFESNLTADRDITIYARNLNQTSTKLEVYLANTTNKITEFSTITTTGYYKVYLTGMQGNADTFDLKIVDNNGNANSYLEFDLIIDPSPQPGITRVDINSTNPAVNDTLQNITLTLVNVTAATKNITSWFVNGAGWTVLNMPFENGSNATFTRDYSGTNNSGINNGTVSRATFSATAGIDGFGAYQFDGTARSINITSGSLNLTDDFTIMAWVNVSERTNRGIMEKTIGSVANQQWSLFVETNQFKFRVNSSATDALVTINSGTITAGIWYHVTAVKSDKGTFLFVNGALVTENIGTAAMAATNIGGGTFLIGMLGSNLYRFNGTIDDVRVYNRSLSAEQIRAIYSNETEKITFREVGAGETWSACVTPTNTSTEGNTICSANYTILATAPTITSVDINSTNVTSNNTYQNITIYVRNATDSNGGSVKNITNWFVNGISATIFNFPFDSAEDPSDSGNIRDYSGLGNNATAGNITDSVNPLFNATAGVDGRGAYQFDGFNDYLDADKADNNFPSTNKSFSIEFWMNLRNATAKTSNILADEHLSGVCTTGRAGYGLTVLTTRFVDIDVMASNGCVVSATTTARISENTWYHVVAVRDISTAEYLNGTLKIYINGVLNVSVNATQAGYRNHGHLFIGGNYPHTPINNWMNGTLDELRIWNRSLSAQQILALYQNNTDFIVSQETKYNETWSACVTPHDRTIDGNTVCTTNNFTVLNVIPTMARVDINTTDPTTNDTDTNITIYPRSVNDSDGEGVKNITQWYLNGDPVITFNMPFEVDVDQTGTSNIRDYADTNTNATSGNASTSTDPTFLPTGGFDGRGVYEFRGGEQAPANGNYLDVGDVAKVGHNNSFSVEFWVYFYQINTRQKILENFHASETCTSGRSGWNIELLNSSGPRIIFVAQPSNACTNSVSSGMNLSAFTWYHIVTVRDLATTEYVNGTLKIYINGVLNATANASNSGFADHDHLFIGGVYPHTDTVNFWLDGRVDDIRIWNRSLSAQQIDALYQNRTDLIVAQETISGGENWSACVTPNDGINDGNTVCTTNNITLTANTAPNITTGPNINPISPNTTDTLNCSFVVTDTDAGDTLNANVTFFRDNVVNYSANVTFTSGLNASLSLPAGRQNKDEVWICQVRPFDGTEFGTTLNSTARTVVNSAPPIPDLQIADHNNITTNRTPYFNWSSVVDADGDTVTYRLMINCSGGCASDDRLISVGTNQNTLADDLEFFGDDGNTYNWTVEATDGSANSSYNSSPRTFTVNVLVDITVPSGNVSFGRLLLGQSNDTSDNSPNPFRIQNNGNVLTNINISANASIWTSDSLPTNNYQYKIDNFSNENNSFIYGSSNTTYANVPAINNTILIGLNHTDITDSAEVDINLTVPLTEPLGNKSAGLRFIAYRRR